VYVTTLEYKPDWEEARQRWTAWWRGETLDRAVLTVYAPRACPQGDGTVEYPPCPATPLERWTNLDYLDAINLYSWRTTFYGAEAFPMWCPGYPGHVGMPTFYGCPIELDWDTGWHRPILTGERLDTSGLTVDRASPWWQFGMDIHRRARASSLGKAVPGMCAIFGGGDTLGMLRGSERLMLDLMDQPKAVLEAEIRFMHEWFEVYRLYADTVRAGEDWFATWFPTWAPGTYYTPQCDVGYGISPASFRECFLPATKMQVEYLDYSIFHVDGVGMFPFVDDICRLEALDGLQILPGAGKPSPLHYLDVLQKVQRAGKRLHISIDPAEVPRALELLSARGLCINTSCASEADARRVIEQVAALSVDRG
jgi:5-methyltetrahydrofolate--homocysteine methyltransferase